MEPQPTNHPSSFPAGNSFASLLSAIAAAKEANADSIADDLKADVATLSYDRALENHARYRAAESASMLPAPIDSAESQSLNTSSQRAHRTASVTIRMSAEECAQLRQRAAEANLTISAYLRSCTFEAESLRAEVKKALAELRSQPSVAQQPTTGPKWLRLIRR